MKIEKLLQNMESEVSRPSYYLKTPELIATHVGEITKPNWNHSSMTSINETPTTPEQTVTPAQKIHVRELREKSLNELHKMAVANDLHTSRVSKQELILH